MQAQRPWTKYVLQYACSWLLLWVASEAHAYCRTHTDTPQTGSCWESDSPVLHWTRGCLSYSFHSGVFSRLPRLTETETRHAALEAFRAWKQVDCGQGSFSAQQLVATAGGEPVAFSENRTNESVISVLSPGEWNNHGMDPDAFAITYLWYQSDTGRIFDVDIALNLTQGDFGDCEKPCSDGTIDLQNTLTHEVGHVLGLGHSTVPMATMQADATVGATFMRSLEIDDMRGMCALELPPHLCSGNDPDCNCPPPPIVSSSARSTVGLCSVHNGPGQGHPQNRSTSIVLTCLLLLSVLRLTQRCRRAS